jgi:membrane-associated protein
MEGTLIEWLETNRDFALLIIPVLAFAEACVGVGLLVSGFLLVTVTTLIYQNELASLETIIPLAFFGAALGDHVGFYVGRWIGPGFHDSKLAAKYLKQLNKGEEIIRKYGVFALFIGRFVPAIRSLIPALLGISGFNRLRYTLLDLSACLLWVVGLALITAGVSNLFSG